jgi:hypothetical protein
MANLVKNIVIEASKEKVWDALLDHENFKKWASVFHEGSYAETDWKEGSKVRFLGPEGVGMTSRIARHRPNKEIIIEHLGIIKDNKEDLESDQAKKWKGIESYRVEEQGKKTELEISVDLPPDEVDWFRGKWDEALQKVKEIAEA